MITPALLRAMMPAAGARAEQFADALAAARVRWVGDDPIEVAHWLAQLAHESGQLRYTRELADGSAYEGRTNLGNTQPGDGRRFRGRGLIQLTGRANYARYAAAAGVDVVGAPELLEQLPGAADSAGWFWSANRIGERTAGATDRVLAVTRIVNGGTNGIEERRRFYGAALAALGSIAAPRPAEHPSAPPLAPSAPVPAPAPAPSGESPDYGKPAPMVPILPIITAVLPSIISAIPELGKLFGSGSEVSQRNIAGATKVLEAVTQATGAVNAVDAAEKIAADPAQADAARQAVQAIWFELVEAGGGGIDGARKADAARGSEWVWYRSASFMIALPLLLILSAAVASILFPALGGDWPPDTRTAVVTLIVGSIVGSLTGYFYGSTTGKPSSGPR